VEQFAENAWAKLIARFVMPLLITAVGAIGTMVLTDLRKAAEKAQTAAEAARTAGLEARGQVATAVQQIQANRELVQEQITGLRRDMDAANGYQDRRLDDHDRRLGVLERGSRAP
jgi:hypothetical protein